MKYNTIEELVNENTLWFKYALEISNDILIANEILSDMYLQLIVLKNKQPYKEFSKAYVYKSLKHFYIKIKLEDNKNFYNRVEDYEYINIDDNEEVEESIDAYDFYNYTLNYLSNVTDRNDWFHKTIFKYVVIDGMSIRELERQSKIHFNILQSSIQSTKKKLKENYKPKNG